MRRAFPVAVALMALLEAAAFAGPRHDPGAQRRISGHPRPVASRVQAPPRTAEAEAPRQAAYFVRTRTDGKPLSCAEIRAMDEVELITDESYCD